MLRSQKLPEVLFSVVVQGKQNLNGFFRKIRKGTHLHLSAGPPGIIKHSCVANNQTRNLPFLSLYSLHLTLALNFPLTAASKKVGFFFVDKQLLKLF